MMAIKKKMIELQPGMYVRGYEEEPFRKIQSIETTDSGGVRLTYIPLPGERQVFAGGIADYLYEVRAD